MTNRITSKFGAKSTAMEVVKGISLNGKRAVITGATSGIGVETARAIAATGAQTTLAVRDVKRGEEVAKDIRKTTGNTDVTVMHLDLGSLSSVRAFAKDYLGQGKGWFSSQPKPLHLLINNAGIMATPQTYTPDGFESQFGTNHLAHFLLAELLMPALTREGGRVVALSSIAHRRSDIHFDDINYKKRPYDKWEAYGQSKTANALFAVGLTKRYKAKGVTANAVMPGGIMTGLQENLSQEEMRAMGWLDENGKLRDGFKTIEQGAATTVWAATAPELKGVGGLYLEDCAEAEPWVAEKPFAGVVPHARSAESAERLWTVSKQMTGS